jgi:hypothetical protein
LSSNKNLPILITFPGSAGLFPLYCGIGIEHIGNIKKLHEQQEIHFAGVSSGTIVALLFALSIPEAEIHELYKKFISYFDGKNTLLHWYEAAEKWIYCVLEEDGYLKLNNKFFIGITVVENYSFTYKIVSKFKSNKDVVDAILASAHLFIFFKYPFRIYKNKYVCDGGFLDNRVQLYDHINYYPRLKKDFKINFPDRMLSISKEKWERLTAYGKENGTISKFDASCKI